MDEAAIPLHKITFDTLDLAARQRWRDETMQRILDAYKHSDWVSFTNRRWTDAEIQYWRDKGFNVRRENTTRVTFTWRECALITP